MLKQLWYDTIERGKFICIIIQTISEIILSADRLTLQIYRSVQKYTPMKYIKKEK